MRTNPKKKPFYDGLVTAGILACAALISMALSGIHDDNNPFATPVFILAVALVARLTDGYACAISRSPLDKNPMPGHLFELHPVNEVNTKGQ